MDYIKNIEHNPEYKDKIVLFKDKINRVKKTSKSVFTDFLNPDEQIILKNMCLSERLYFESCGGNGDFERAVCVISSDVFKDEYPVEVIRVKGNFKFEKLTHRDYLGSILSLGIKREKIGDINVFEDGAEVWVYEGMGSYIEANLDKIKHTGIKVETINILYARQSVQKFKEMKINVPSMRLDCIVAALAGISRNEAVNAIKKGNIKVDYIIIGEPSEKVNAEQLISIRGNGRYRINSLLSKTKSDRLNITVKKYI